MKKGRRVALVALIGIVVLIVGLTVVYFAVPLKTSHIVRLRVVSPGEIFLGDQKVGTKLAEIELTGNEDCLIPMADITEQELLKAIAPMGRIISVRRGSGYTHSGGAFPISGATYDVMLSRADGTFDSVVFIAVRVESIDKVFAIPLRVKQGLSCAARTHGAGVRGSKGPLEGLYERIVLRRKSTSVVISQEILVDPAPDRLWWLDSRLKELGSGTEEAESAPKK